jgi:hypothetical protein
MNKYLPVLIALLGFGLVGCESFQMIDEYKMAEVNRVKGDYGCFIVRNLQVQNRAYVEECGARNLVENYTTGFTLGIIDLSAGQFKFEEALLSQINSEQETCKILRANEVSIMGNTQGIEFYYECSANE